MPVAAPSPDQTLAFQWIVGALVVVLYARDRFRSPQPMRASTTFWRYWSAFVGYVASMLMLFVVFGGGLSAVDPKVLMQLLQVDAETSALPGPLLSAMLLTSLLPHAPVLGKLDEAVKRWFQRVGNIPFEVRELSAHLRQSAYAPSAAQLALLRDALAARGVDPAWLHESPDTLRHRWARCVALHAQLQRWESTRGYAGYVDDHRTALAELGQRLDTQAELLGPATLPELDRESGSALAATMRRKLAVELGVIDRALCDFASGGVLNRGWNESQRRDALGAIGFGAPPPAQGPLSSHDLVLVAGIVFLAMLFVPLATRRLFDPTPLPVNVRVLVMVPIIYAIAIVLAVYPKSVWAFARRADGGARPVAAYAVSGLMAAGAAFVVSLLFRFAFESQGSVLQVLATPGSFVRAWRVTVERWPWLLMTFFATIAIAWAADDHPPGRGAAPRWLRWAEGAALAAVFALLQWMVLQLLAAALAPGQAAPLLASTGRMLVTAMLIGAAIGGIVPQLCREREARRAAPPALPALQPA